MFNPDRCAKVNVKVLAVLILVTVAIASSLFAAREVRRNLLSKMDLDAGQAAFEKEDWATAAKRFQGYLGRNPDDLEVLKKYARARLSVRPLDTAAVAGAIAAYRRVMQLDPLDGLAYEKLAELYAGIGNFEELAYIAQTRLDHVPEDRKAPLWLADALYQLRKTGPARESLDKLVKELDPVENKPAEYVEACVLMSKIITSPGSGGTTSEALDWLNKAVSACPQSVEARAHRARFYRTTQDIPDMNEASGLMSEDQRLARARKDLDAADALGTENPRVRLLLGAEWLEHEELDRTAAELQAVEKLPQEVIAKHFFDLRDWTAARFLFAAQLAAKRKTQAEGVSLADEVLGVLTEKRHRVRVLPSAVMLYVAGGKVAEARRCLDEYLETMYTQEVPAESRLRLAYLQALVARAEDKPYVVIDVLQPAVVMDASRPELWRLLAEAFSRTDQSRRAVSALVKYLRVRPRDPEMTIQLAREYLKLRDWSRAFETARLAEPMDPTDIVIRLLRIESSIYRVAEQSYRPSPSSLEPLAAELAQLRKDHPESVDIRILQAMIADYLQKPDEAEQGLKQAIEQCPEPLRAEMQLVKLYYGSKRLTEAISTCLAACQRNPKVAEPWLALSGLHAAKADYDAARSALTTGLQSVVNPWERRSLSIQLALIEIYYGQPADRAGGIRLLGELAQQDPQEIRARTLLLNVREVWQDRPAAEKLIGELKTAEGESGLYWRLYQAALWLAADDWRSRQQDIVKAAQYCIDLDPEWSAPALLLASVYEKLGDFRRMEETYSQALVRNPAATDVADALITLLERQGRYSDAEKVLSQIETNPRLTSAWHVRMALSSQDYARAIEELKLRVSNDDRDANSRILLARLTYWQGGPGAADQAFTLLKQAEAITPDSLALIGAKVAILRAAGQAEEAGQVLDAYVAKSKAFSAFAMRAAYLANAGQLELAEQDYRKLTGFPAQEGTAGYEQLSNFYVRTGKLDQAVTALEEGLAAHPDDMRLARRLMRTLFLRGQTQDQQRALGMLAALQEKLPHDPELMKLRALAMLQQPTAQSLKTARAQLEEVIKLEPTAVDAHLMLIGMAMQEGDYRTARDLAIQAAGANPTNMVLVSARAGAELKLKNTQIAIELSRLVLRQDPGNAEALSIAAQCKDRGLLDEARTLIESAAAANPADDKLLIARARVSVALGQPQTAIPSLQAYSQTKAGASNVSALVTLADLYRVTGDMDRAAQTIEQAEKIDRSNLTVIHARFLWLLAQKRFSELSQISSAYLSAKEQNVTTLIAAASLLAACDSAELRKEGLQLLEQAVTLAPVSKDARLTLASTLYQTGDADRAVTIYRQWLEQYPNDAQALNDLAWILQERDRQYDAALELANKGLAVDPDELHLLDTRGTILSNMGDRLEDAKRDFERLVGVADPDTRQKASALLKLGRICLKLKDLAQAKQHLQDALKIDQKIGVFTAEERSEITSILQTGGVQAVNK